MGIQYQDELIIKLKMETAQATKAALSFEKIMKKIGYATVTHNPPKLFSQKLIDEQTKAIKREKLAAVDLMDKLKAKELLQAERNARKAKMSMLSFGFAALFTGMALKRLSENIITSLIKTYMTATDEQNRFHQELMGVHASFEFLKFSIMDALGNNEYVIAFVEVLIEMVNRISEFVSKHPQISLILGVFLAMSVVLGSISMVIGQIALASIGLSVSMGGLFGIILLVAVVTALLVSLFTTDMREADPVLTAIKVILLAIALIVLAIMSPILGVIALFVAIGAVIAKLREDFGSWGNFFKAVLRGLIMALGFVGEAIFEFLMAPFKIVALALIGIINLMNKITGSTYSTEGLWDFVKMTPVLTGAAELANKIEFDETKGKLFSTGKGDVNINVNGDVTDANLMDRIKIGVDELMNTTNYRYNGTSTGG